MVGFRQFFCSGTNEIIVATLLVSQYLFLVAYSFFPYLASYYFLISNYKAVLYLLVFMLIFISSFFHMEIVQFWHIGWLSNCTSLALLLFDWILVHILARTFGSFSSKKKNVLLLWAIKWSCKRYMHDMYFVLWFEF